MKLLTGLSMLAALLAVAVVTRAADKPPAESKMAPLERFAGEWEIDSKWSDGTPLKARSEIEWGLNKKILKAKTFVKDGDKEYQRYESVFAWHPEKKQLYQISFAYDGSIGETLIEDKGDDTLHIGYEAFDPKKPSTVRQIIKFLDKDHYQWKVSIKDGDGWKEIMDSTWKRKSKQQK
jgi:hypothetical protein